MTWRKHGKHSLLTLLTSALKFKLRRTRSSLYQPSLRPPLPAPPAPAVPVPQQPQRRAKIIPFPHVAAPLNARPPGPQLLLLPSQLPCAKVPDRHTLLSWQVGLR